MRSESEPSVVTYAKAQDDGSAAVSSEFVDRKPRVVVLVATTPERAALLHALHESWYPEGDDDWRHTCRFGL